MVTSSPRPSTSRENKERVDELEYMVGEVALVKAPDAPSGKFSWRTLWAYSGPGWLMSIAYLDPGNLESDLQAGAYGGYQLIWVLFLATLMGLILQIMAARLGVVTGHNLAQTCRKEYSRPTYLCLWVMTEIAIVGSDIQEVMGSAIAFKLLFGWPLWVGCLVTALDTFTFLFIHACGVRKLESFFAVLIGTMAVCFFVDFSYSAPPSHDVLGGFEPKLANYAVVQAVGLIGAVIMPHNIYLHSALVQSRAVNRRDPRKVSEACLYFSIEAAIALLVSFLINVAIVSVFAAEFFDVRCASAETTSACVPFEAVRHGDATYGFCDPAVGASSGSCQEIGLEGAGEVLRGVLGGSAHIVWGIGLLAAGQSSTMTGTYAGQFVMEGFIQLKVAPWVRVAVTRFIALGPALVVALASESSDGASDKVGEWLNVLQSVQLPFALLPILHFTSSRRLMGPHANSAALRLLCWVLAGLVLGVNVYLIQNFISDKSEPVPHADWFYALVGLLGVAYFGFIGYLIKSDVAQLIGWLRGEEQEEGEERRTDPLLGASGLGDEQLQTALNGGQEVHYVGRQQHAGVNVVLGNEEVGQKRYGE